MKKLRVSLYTLIVFTLLFFSGCVKNNDYNLNQTIVEDTEGLSYILKNQDDWIVNAIGLNNLTVSEIQLTSKGVLYALAEGKLYEIEDINKTKIICEDVELSTFYILEYKNNVIIVAGGITGEVYIYSSNSNQWEKADIDTYNSPISKINGNVRTGEIYLGQSSSLGGGLWKSTNNGKTWTKITDITVRGITIHPQHDSYIYIVDKLAYVSKDSGKSFMKINTEANYGVLIHPLYSDAVYHAFSKGVVTTDINGNISTLLKFYLEGSMTRLEFNPVNKDEWLVGFWDFPSGAGGIYHSTSQGTLWKQIEGELENKMVYDIEFSKAGSIAYLSTKSHGIWAINLNKLKLEEI